MRRFEVWLDVCVTGVAPYTVEVEFPDSATQEDIDKECRSTLDELVGGRIDTGWRELTDGGES